MGVVVFFGPEYLQKKWSPTSSPDVVVAASPLNTNKTVVVNPQKFYINVTFFLMTVCHVLTNVRSRDLSVCTVIYTKEVHLTGLSVASRKCWTKTTTSYCHSSLDDSQKEAWINKQADLQVAWKSVNYFLLKGQKKVPFLVGLLTFSFQSWLRSWENSLLFCFYREFL